MLRKIWEGLLSIYLSIHSQFAVPASEVAIDAVVDVDISLECFQANLKMTTIINFNSAAVSLCSYRTLRDAAPYVRYLSSQPPVIRSSRDVLEYITEIIRPET